MSDVYTPPFTMTIEIANKVIEIGELVGRITADMDISRNPILRRENRIKTIHSSLAIEANTLSLAQVTDVIDGKRVLAPAEDIKEVKNAYKVYDEMQNLDPYSVTDLLHAHKLMMSGLVLDAGQFRSGNVGVYNGDVLIHPGTPARYVPGLIDELFCWLRESQLHPLIKSCIFHYEFEFIHPFSDGNGRTGRLWHSLILGTWQPFFAWLPVETMIHDNQQAYYNAIEASNDDSDSGAFVMFMLDVIKSSLTEFVTSSPTRSLLDLILAELTDDCKLSAAKLAIRLNVSQRQVERCLSKLKADGRIRREGSNKSGQWIVK